MSKPINGNAMCMSAWVQGCFKIDHNDNRDQQSDVRLQWTSWLTVAWWITMTIQWWDVWLQWRSRWTIARSIVMTIVIDKEAHMITWSIKEIQSRQCSCMRMVETIKARKTCMIVSIDRWDWLKTMFVRGNSCNIHKQGNSHDWSNQLMILTKIVCASKHSQWWWGLPESKKRKQKQKSTIWWSLCFGQVQGYLHLQCTKGFVESRLTQ